MMTEHSKRIKDWSSTENLFKLKSNETCVLTHHLARLSIYKPNDVRISSNLIGLQSLDNGNVHLPGGG